MTGYQPRAIARLVQDSRAEMPVVIVTGLRQSGKSTFLQHEKALAARWDERDLAGLKAFLDKTKQCRLAILAYGGRGTVRLGDRLWAAPLAAVLS